jgi:hypothetical protein
LTSVLEVCSVGVCVCMYVHPYLYLNLV